MSAKSRVWQGHVVSRVAGFSGFSEFLSVLATVLGVERTDDKDLLKARVLETMKGYRGLVIVDNIEDVKDEQVIRFLFREVPDPVKVLVTSRVERALGSLSVPIPEMNQTEARELFEFELARQGYQRKQSDTAAVNSIVDLTGRIPLALKWSASIAAKQGSLEAAEATFRGAQAIKQEFLTFCFTTMFEELSKEARWVALLHPYLDTNWTLPILSIALDIPEENVLQALAELEQRGLIFWGNKELDGMPNLLPLTKEFLSIKAKQHPEIEQIADARLAAALGDANPLVAGLDRKKQIEVLISAIRRQLADGRVDEAEKLVNFLVQKLDGRDDGRAQFLAGHVLYLKGDKVNGKTLMQQALGKLATTQDGPQFDLTFGQVLINATAKQDRHEGAGHLVRACARGEELTGTLVAQLCDVLVRQGDFAALRTLISINLKLAAYLQIAKTLDRLGVLQNTQRLYELGPTLKAVFEEASRIRTAELAEPERHRFLSVVSTLDKLFGQK